MLVVAVFEARVLIIVLVELFTPKLMKLIFVIVVVVVGIVVGIVV